MTMYRVRVVFSGLQGAPYLATHYFDVAGGTAAQAVGDVAGFWTGVDAGLDSELTWATEASVDSINEATGALVTSTSVTPLTGTGGTVGPVLPFAAQGLARWRTNGIVAGRRVRGRTFIPGITELGVDNGVLLASTISNINTQGQAMIDSLNSIAVVWSRPVAANPTATPPVVARSGTMHPVVGVDTWNQLAVLRSRRD